MNLKGIAMLITVTVGKEKILIMMMETKMILMSKGSQPYKVGHHVDEDLETLIPGGTRPFEGGHRGFVGSSNEPNPPFNKLFSHYK